MLQEVGLNRTFHPLHPSIKENWRLVTDRAMGKSRVYLDKTSPVRKTWSRPSLDYEKVNAYAVGTGLIQRNCAGLYRGTKCKY
ncbi:hypothetical protein C5167_019904 [Papaver somniferum]|uniref:Uncharacterized protein n=1 Tax=Papaver somniferum TaxID=3469 RepID=A0A4Y7ITL5_PAPSO|nr:hypothetical protein C5167_019904 [Papaver somniferum]